MDIRIKRAYDDPATNDGTRVLVDRVWPRGVAKADLDLDDWNKDVAPSTSLRRWYSHDAEKFEEFAQRYRKELDTQDGRAALQALKASVTGKRLTLVTATKDVEHSQAAVLAELLGA
ncbi:DUF488 family protein [Nocardioides sp. JQ2195]|uniref:DUF488 domain-containing protein n=1 Tax=Nocardioides sp. JQ2195 TaxID=2592334 RepID=UPI00143E8519|nr:DUF488 family protein [Nocardioides sp. JQ2195]QIX28398.1 DUF488 family protein [Nocardioides sp. JQ2195]